MKTSFGSPGQKEAVMIPAVIERCAGIDIGKKFLVACVMIGPANGDAHVEIREFGTTVAELKQLRDWLQQQGCTHAAIESTGSYWKPVYNVLEDSLQVVLANPQEVKGRKGHKTDRKDSWWLAHLLRHGMITASFVPPRWQRELRDLTRRRRKLIQTAASEKNRVEKVLEDANVKLSSVLSDLFGVSGQLMIEALLEGKGDPQQIAQFAKMKARKKIPEIVAALEQHQMNSHHRMMINFSLDHLRFLEDQIIQLDEEIAKKIRESGYLKEWELLQSLPAVQESSGASILAEIGPDMQQFGSEKRISSWAKICPGNNRSAGQDKGGRIMKGNRWLRTTLTECAWAASNKRDCHLKEKFWRLAGKNKGKAAIALAHEILILAYFVLSRGTPYEEKLNAEIEERQQQHLIRHHIRRLGKLGVRLRPTLERRTRPKKNKTLNG